MIRHCRRFVSTAIPLVVVALTFVGCTSGQSDGASPDLSRPFDAAVTVPSPDDSLRVEVGVDGAGRARYRLVRRHDDGVEEIVVGDSTLGLELTFDGIQPLPLAAGGTIADTGELVSITDEFDLPTGKARRSRIEANTRSITVGFGEALDLQVDLWVSNEGAAFRYVLAGPTQSVARIEWERTSFSMPATNRTWLQPHDAPGPVTPAYERVWSRAAVVSSPGISSFGWTFPALFASDRSWTLLTESALHDGAAGSHLSSVVADGEFFVDLADRSEGNGVGDPRPLADEGWRSPWRIIITSPELGTIVESNVVRHLSGITPDPIDTDWIEPGRVSWSWWSDHESSQDADAIEPFIDLAAEMGWEYSLIDANWTSFSDERLEALVRYGEERDVDLFLWYNSGGSNNIVTEAPRGRMDTADARRVEFARLSELGIAGVKVDFFQSDKPDVIQRYRDILTDAAAAELLVNFHGSTVPRGWSREFPHLMTMEAVRGAEIYTFDAGYAAVAPRQNTVLPFTRNVVGPMDYTPVILGDTVRRDTTNGHELALAVVFESGLQHFVDTPEAYLSQPPEVIDLLGDVPSVWDETQFLSGEPETHVAIARRLGDTWWIGVINGQNEQVSITLNLDPLDIDTTARIVRVCDNPDWEGQPGSRTDWNDPDQYRISVSLDGRVLDVPANGGCLIRLGG